MHNRRISRPGAWRTRRAWLYRSAARRFHRNRIAEPVVTHVCNRTGTSTMADTAAELGPLPRWDLTDLYPGPNSPELARDLERCGADPTAFPARHEGKVAAMQIGRAAWREKVWPYG